MKSLIASCVIFAIVSMALFTNSAWLTRESDTLREVLYQLPTDTKGDPEEYGIAMRNAHIIWKEMRRRIEITVPLRILDPMDRALQGIEAGWLCGDDAVYRRSLAEALTAVAQIHAYEGISLSAIL